MTFVRPTQSVIRRLDMPPPRPVPSSDFRNRMTAQFLARALPSMSEEERFSFEERIAICMFDGNLTEAEATRVALNDYASQRARSKQ